MSTVHAKNHTLIVHFPSEARVRQLIRELQTDGSEIVVIADRIESLPFQEKNVSFVRGSTVSEETYRRASIETAKKAVVLSTSYEETNSDAVVASAASVIDHLKPSIHLVAECLDDQHRMLFNSVNADAIVSVMRITGNLLVQESQDPGVSQVFDIITSNLEGDVIYSCQVDSDSPSAYSEIAKQLLDRDINLLAVTRGKETHTAFSRIQPQKGDHVVYLAPQRQQWSDLTV